MPIEYATKKELTETQKNRIKRLERAFKEGRLGRFISWFDLNKDKKELTFKDFDMYKTPFGRIGNRVYECSANTNYKFILYRKFKNTTKAKKFLGEVYDTLIT